MSTPALDLPAGCMHSHRTAVNVLKSEGEWVVADLWSGQAVLCLAYLPRLFVLAFDLFPNRGKSLGCFVEGTLGTLPIFRASGLQFAGRVLDFRPCHVEMLPGRNICLRIPRFLSEVMLLALPLLHFVAGFLDVSVPFGSPVSRRHSGGSRGLGWLNRLTGGGERTDQADQEKGAEKGQAGKYSQGNSCCIWNQRKKGAIGLFQYWAAIAPLSCKVVDLTPGSREGVFYRYVGMFMTWVISGRMINNDVLVRWNRQPNVDLKADAMAMLLAWSDNGDAASRNAFIVCLQPFDLL
jgi:hypothetical protein